jgi:hypothetical protein
LECAFGVVGKDLDKQDFNGIYLVRFGFRMWEILICDGFLPLKTQINSKKPGFGRKKSVEDAITLGPTPRATLVGMNVSYQHTPQEGLASNKRPLTNCID